ncbi:adenosine deaminase [Allosalinactinospora lopnorensis]|uniref:adenosine deaminase n=1 Tax=Allosalinactinospora lopnorensis TaxID=1352348 RepID=UPI000623BE2F|nr:adenosine deaminase [Allosalinactinospora lopnorensis]
MSDIHAIPKAELHVHIEGTLEPEMAFALAERNGLARPAASIEELRARYRFRDLQSFLDIYYANMAVLRTATDFHDLAGAYFRRAAAQGVRHAEVFFDPQAHLARGVPMQAVVEGLYSAVEEARARGLSADLIMCFLRDVPAEDALRTLRRAEPFLDRIIGVGLDSAEVGHPPDAFAEVFSLARTMGLHAVAHAGEEGPPAYVRTALDVLGARRIDHGIRALEDPRLVARLREERVPLTVCPLSNVRLRVVDTLSAHPLPRMLSEGLLATVNSDDPAYFGGYVADNYAAVRDELGLSQAELRQLAVNSFEASFLSGERKAELAAEVFAWALEQQ